jgi:hypothetical protein
MKENKKVRKRVREWRTGNGITKERMYDRNEERKIKKWTAKKKERRYERQNKFLNKLVRLLSVQ